MTITLTAASRQNLLSLQDTASLQSLTQNRLSTGKKVASALDNPVSFFTAQSLDNRANDLSTLLDGISNGIQTIQAADRGLTNITKLVDQAKGIANQALATSITTSGTAANVVAVAGGTAAFYVNGTAVSYTVAAASSASTVAAGLNSAIDTALSTTGTNFFTVDATGTKLVVNANADIEFKDTAAQTALGFTTNATAGGG
jgi:flagellin